ncbi:MAG: protein kinase [Pirellulales bacterium]|nr:protein kinase [Pirellulales bacterium]
MNDRAHDDPMTDQLVDYQQRLDGGLSSRTAASDDSLPPELAHQLHAAQKCLDLLHGLRQERERAARSATGETMPLGDTTSGGRELDVQIPRRIGRFQIRLRLGMGGFGIVYRAFDPETRREVALKVPRPEALANRELLERFSQEAQAAARLDHAHIVTVHESGYSGAIPIIVSAFYDAPTMSAWMDLRPGPVEARTAAATVAALADAVQHAHQRGVLHRDIKPSNVLMVPSTEDDRGETSSELEHVPKLMDFGLAKVTDATLDLTHTGAMLGTLMYMPPEQAAGNLAEIGPRSDVYGLGVLLYEILTDRAPFHGTTQVETLRRVMHEAPAPLRALRRDVPRDLETICLKCLEKEPARRYASARALTADLRRFLAGEPIQARPATPAERAAKWCRRNPQWASLFAVVLLGVTALLGFLTYSNARISLALTIERATRHELNAQLYAADVRRAGEAFAAHNPQQAIDLLAKYEQPEEGYDLREFAWHYSRSRVHVREAFLPKHPADVYRLLFSPSGKWIFTACADGKVRIWRGGDRQLERLLDCGSEVNEVALSPDEQWLAAGCDDGLVRVWNTNNWQLHSMLETSGAAWLDLAWYDQIFSLATQPDGKVLAAGFFVRRGHPYGAVVLRFNPDGTRDEDFEYKTYEPAEPGFHRDFGRIVLCQPDGRFILVGDTYFDRNPAGPEQMSTRFILVRFLPDGTPDPAFQGGIHEAGTGRRHEHLRAACLQPDGKIVTVGYAADEKDERNTTAPILVRYDASGVLEPDFGTGSGSVDNSAVSHLDSAYAIVLQEDGKIVVAGETQQEGKTRLALVRCHADGTRDASFGQDGMAVLSVGDANLVARRIALQSDGRIVVGADFLPHYQIAILRVHQDGCLDDTFGEGGLSTLAVFGDDAETLPLAIQPDQKIVVAGASAPGPPNLAALVRLQENGALDASFGTAGTVLAAMGHSYELWRDVLIQSDGKILAGGTATDGNLSRGEIDFVLARFQTNGTLDQTWNADSVVGLQFSPDSTSLYAAGDHAVSCWNVEHGVKTGAWRPATKEELSSMSLSSDGKCLGIATRKRGYIWSLPDSPEGETHTKLAASAIALLPGRDEIVVGYEHGRIDCYDNLEMMNATDLEVPHPGRVQALRATSDGRYLTSTSQAGGAHILRTDNWQRIAAISNPSGRIWDVHYLPEPNQAIITDVQGNVDLVRIKASNHPMRTDGGVEIHRTAAAITAADLSVDGSLLACGERDGRTTVLSLASGEVMFDCVGHPQPVQRIAFDKSNRQIHVVYYDGRLATLDIATSKELSHLEMGRKIHRAAFSPETDQVALAFDDAYETIVMRWDSKAERRRFTSQNSVSRLEFSHDGKALLLCCASDLEIGDLTTGQLVRKPGKSAESCSDLAELPLRGKLLVAEGLRGVAIRDYPSLELTSRLVSHASGIVYVAVTPNERNAATLSEDGMLTVWDLRTEQPVLSFLECIRGVATPSLMFTPDGTKLVAVLSALPSSQIIVWATADSP